MRSVLRQLIMRPRDVAVFSDDVSEVVDDLINRIVCLRRQSSDGTTICNINDLFFKYAMEGGQHLVLLANCHHSEISPRLSLYKTTNRRDVERAAKVLRLWCRHTKKATVFLSICLFLCLCRYSCHFVRVQTGLSGRKDSPGNGRLHWRTAPHVQLF